MSAWSVAQKARAWVRLTLGVKIALAAKDEGIGNPLAFALVEQESGFRNVFGCDYGEGELFCHKLVTRRRFKKLRQIAMRTQRSNGVGYTQITYWTYLRDNPDIWRAGPNLRLGFSIVKANVDKYGLRQGLAVYNGGASNPNWDYAEQVLERRTKWQKRFA